MSDLVRIDRKGDVAYVRLSRPDKRNALTLQTMSALVEAGRQLRRDRHLRAVILHGEGESFCSGLDFPSTTKQPAKVARAFVKAGARSTNLFQECCWVWRRVPVPVVAVLHGHCFGAGLQLALAADFRFATPDCELSILEAKWGLIPDMTGSVTLRELMPVDRAKLLTMTGRIFDGREAERLNLVTRVEDDPMAAAEALVEEMRQRSPDSVAATKALFSSTWTAAEAKAFRIERRLQALLLLGKNQRIAARAAFAKELPRFAPRSFGAGGREREPERE